MKNMANMFNDSNLYISKKDKKIEPEEFEEEIGEKWVAIEQAHP